MTRICSPGWLLWAALLLMLAPAVQAAAGLEAWLDRDQVSLGETVQLTIKAEGRVSGEPDTTPLERDFHVLGTSSGSSIQITGGQMSSTTTWQITLAPRREGVLAIGPLELDGRFSNALSLTVTAAPAPRADSGADLFLETEVEPGTPYARQQVLYRVRLFHAVPLTEGSLSAPQPDNTLMEQLGEDQAQELTRQNRRYRVIERTYALFPQETGQLTLPPPVFRGMVRERDQRRDPRQFFFGNDPFGMLGGTTRPVRIAGQPFTLTVRPAPLDAAGVPRLPAFSLELAEEWQPEEARIRVGEAVTRAITVTAQGQTGAALPEPAAGAVEGFKVYPDKAELTSAQGRDGITGTRRQKTAFIPTRPGTYTLPGISLPWWDVASDQARESHLPPRTIFVLPGDQPAEAAASPPSPATPAAPATAAPAAPLAGPAAAGGPVLGPAATLAMGIAWLSTLLLWWRDRRRYRRPPPDGDRHPSAPARLAEAGKAVAAACAAHDPAGARQALLLWAAARWPTDPPPGLSAIATRLGDPDLTTEIDLLGRRLFAAQPAPWDGQRLAQLFRQAAAAHRPEKKKNPTLPALYP
ncbi:MAG: BatD family protein [Thermodesulfobacteriota bacterium]